MLRRVRPCLSFLGLAVLVLPVAAQARPAQCETSDDGAYPCDFRATGTDGSFEISAKGKPTFDITVSQPGVATAYLVIGNRSTELPGPHRLSRKELGCWVSDATRTKICAR